MISHFNLGESSWQSITLEAVLKQRGGITLYKARCSLPCPSPSLSSTCTEEPVVVREVVYDQLQGCYFSDLWREVSFRFNINHPNLVALRWAFSHNGVQAQPTTEQSPLSHDQPLATSSSSSSFRREPSQQLLQWSPIPAFCLVEEMVDGCSVAEYLLKVLPPRSQRPSQSSHCSGMAPNLIAAVAYDVLCGLRHLHEDCHYAHRNIQSPSLLLDKPTGRVKLSHLDCCGQPWGQAEGCTTIVGSFAWMAPEMCQSGGVAGVGGGAACGSHGLAVDLWSMGITVLEMALGTICSCTKGFAHLVSEISRIPCSVQTSTSEHHSKDTDAALDDGGPAGWLANRSLLSSALRDVLEDQLLLDFIACCLRVRPQVRPTAAQLMEHPFLSQHDAFDPLKRSHVIGSLVRAVEQCSGLTGGGTNTQEATSTPDLRGVEGRDRGVIDRRKSRNDSAESVEISAEATNHHRMDSTHTQYSWVIPTELRSMFSADGWGQSQPNVATAGPGSDSPGSRQVSEAMGAPPRSLYESVIAPATMGSRRILVRAVRALQKMDPVHVPHYPSGGGGDDCRSPSGEVESANARVIQCVANLQSRKVSAEQVGYLYDNLSRAFDSVNTESSPMCSELCYDLLTQILGDPRSVQSLSRTAIGFQRVFAGTTNHQKQQQKQQQQQVFFPVSYDPSRSVRPLPFLQNVSVLGNTMASAGDALVQTYSSSPVVWATFGNPRTTRRSSPQPQLMPTGDGDGAPDRPPVHNASAFLFNSWLKDQQKGPPEAQ